MREFTKSTKLAHVTYDIRGPIIDEADRMEEAGEKILKLNIGNPARFDFRAREDLIEKMGISLRNSEGYSDSNGIDSARRAIAAYAVSKGIEGVTARDVYTGNGVSDLIQLSLNALLDDGDEILIPAPDYPLWTACSNLAGGKAVHYLCDEESLWYPDVEDIRRKITDRTKAIVIINPNNPTGAVYPESVLREVIEVAREHELILFSDEIYDRLTFDGTPHTSTASLAPDLFCVTFSGLSKSHMMAGFRIGWMVLSGNKKAAADYIEGLKMLSNMRLCSNVPAQSIVEAALAGPDRGESWTAPGSRLEAQRNFICDAVDSIPGLSVVRPRAAFYAFPKIDTARFGITDDIRFVLDFLREKRVMVVQGTGFNWIAPDHFRIVYLPEMDVLRDSMTALRDFLSDYRQG